MNRDALGDAGGDDPLVGTAMTFDPVGPNADGLTVRSLSGVAVALTAADFIFATA